MFSPEATAHGSLSTRNPRRRQRTASDDSASKKINTKRRKRSLLAPDTFDPPVDHPNYDRIYHVNGDSASNGHAVKTRAQRDVSVDTTSLAIRNKGSRRGVGEKRVTETDEGMIQVCTNAHEGYPPAELIWVLSRRRMTITL